MNEAQKNCFSFVFNIDPELNDGYDEAFKQGDEPWWWYSKDGREGPAAGPIPDFTGATFKSLYQWDKQLLP